MWLKWLVVSPKERTSHFIGEHMPTRLDYSDLLITPPSSQFCLEHSSPDDFQLNPPDPASSLGFIHLIPYRPLTTLTSQFCSDVTTFQHSSFQCRNSACSRNSPQPCLDHPKSKWHDGQRWINEAEKCIMGNTVLRTKFRSVVCVQACHAAVWIDIHLWPLRRDDHPGVLIGTGETRRSDWPARVLANDVSTRINR